MMLSATIWSRLAFALSSSTQSGWYQWSCGIWPNDTSPLMTLLIRLREKISQTSEFDRADGGIRERREKRCPQERPNHRS